MGVKNTKIHILSTVFNMTNYNLVCVLIMIVWIRFVVAMVTILEEKYGLPSYQHTF